MSFFRVALAQMNPTVGDLSGNTERILQTMQEARELGADLLAFPELALTGYPAEDLLLKASFLRQNRRCLDRIRRASDDMVTVVGFVDDPDEIYNAAAVLHRGRLAGVHHKTFLPNYGVFDEDRYFMRGSRLSVFRLGSLTFGVAVCEDIWYPRGPGYYQSLAGGAQLLVNLNASPYHTRKWEFRDKMLATRASDNGCYVAYVNAVGGQDELVFDGDSCVVDPVGRLVARAPFFQEHLLICDLELETVQRRRLVDPRRRKGLTAFTTPGAVTHVPPIDRIDLEPRDKQPQRPLLPPHEPPRLPTLPEEVFQALALGTRDYVRKNGFSEVVLGISGGVDSAITAAIAVAALGAEHVHGVYMPSRFSADISGQDATRLCRNLGIPLMVLPIEGPMGAFTQTLAPVFEGRPIDVTEENLQARIRGNLLMALSNKFGWLVLTTGNKSETACGYSTLYGDMAGAFAVIKDVPKVLVYELCRHVNRQGERIPERILTRPPSAELRPDQKDSDSLPEYELLDAILSLYVEEDRSIDGIVEQGFDRDLVRRVVRMVDRNEYKRRQGPPGIKITQKAFGRDRRLPITNRFLEE
jgi:NAD+ synthase (glutamine-hydrolysing)